LSDWDYDLLPIELAGLKEANYDLGLLGFDEDELARLLNPAIKDGLVDRDDVPAPPDQAISQPGDLWHLGNHRLLCGDSTDAGQIAHLMTGRAARMVFTDPPWNVGIGQDSNPRHRQRPGLQNDDLPPDDFRAFLGDFLAAIQPHVAGDFYCVLGASEWPNLDQALRQHGFHWSATIIWVKDAFVLERSKYHRRYEPIWYGWHSAGKSSFGPDRDLDDVWEIPRPRRSDEHPTMKPVELVLRAITNSSRAGDIVLDPFGGSGSTLIAAEQTGRRAFLIEIDPIYCDVIIQRFESFTGTKAERIPAPRADAPTLAPVVKEGAN
jgi:DNA modification methylase